MRVVNMFVILVSIAIVVGSVSAGPVESSTPKRPSPIIINDTLGCLLEAATYAFHTCYSLKHEVDLEEGNLHPEFEMDPPDSNEQKRDVAKKACYAHMMDNAIECILSISKSSVNPIDTREFHHLIGKAWMDLTEEMIHELMINWNLPLED